MTSQVDQAKSKMRRRVLAFFLAVAWVVLVVVVSREYGLLATPFCFTGGGLMGYVISRLAK